MMWGAGSPLAWLSAGPGNMNMSSMGSTEGPTGPETPLPSPTAWDVVLCISGTLVSCENALVVAIIVGTPAFRAPMFLLVGSLAVADLLAGLGLVMHFAAVFCIGSAVMSLVLVGVLAMAFTASIGSLLAITVDRYLSLYNALTYYSETTVTRTYVMLALVWGGALGLGLLPVLAWNCLDARATCGVVYPLSKNHLVVLAVAFFMVFGIMLQLYAQICRIVCRHAQQIALHIFAGDAADLQAVFILQTHFTYQGVDLDCLQDHLGNFIGSQLLNIVVHGLYRQFFFYQFGSDQFVTGAYCLFKYNIAVFFNQHNIGVSAVDN